MRVLVLEDDRDIRETLCELLEDSGYDVVAAINGQDGLRRLGALDAHPAVILLDLMMPVMDGTEFHERLRATPEYSHIPVIVLSAGRGAAEVARSLGAGFLQKPLEIPRMLEMLAEHCARSTERG